MQNTASSQSLAFSLLLVKPRAVANKLALYPWPCLSLTVPLPHALLTAAHSRLSALMAIDGAPSALLTGAPSARHPHAETLLEAAWTADVEYAVGLQQGVQTFAAS